MLLQSQLLLDVVEEQFERVPINEVFAIVMPAAIARVLARRNGTTVQQVSDSTHAISQILTCDAAANHRKSCEPWPKPNSNFQRRWPPWFIGCPRKFPRCAAPHELQAPISSKTMMMTTCVASAPYLPFRSHILGQTFFRKLDNTLKESSKSFRELLAEQNKKDAILDDDDSDEDDAEDDVEEEDVEEKDEENDDGDDRDESDDEEWKHEEDEDEDGGEDEDEDDGEPRAHAHKRGQVMHMHACSLLTHQVQTSSSFV